MKQHLGRISLVVAFSSWAVLVLAMLIGGLDPPRTSTPLLKGATMGALLAATGALCLAAAALARGPQRLAAAFGLVVSLLFLLYFTGFGLAFVR